jgi:hypothetical protein
LRGWLSEHRKLQKSDPVLLRWARSLPTVMPDGPEKGIESECFALFEPIAIVCFNQFNFRICSFDPSI